MLTMSVIMKLLFAAVALVMGLAEVHGQTTTMNGTYNQQLASSIDSCKNLPKFNWSRI